MASTPVAMLFPCFGCGRRNRVSNRLDDAVELWLLDHLPKCKGCGQQLSKDDYTMRESSVILRRVKKKLGLD